MSRPWIALVRHGMTDWNARGLIQGRADIPLNAAGIAALQQARPCEHFRRARWASSPLQRATQTAALLNPPAAADMDMDIDAELIETDWGRWEGLHRAEIPRRNRDRSRNRAQPPTPALDFTPPHGESPRMVRRRIMRWFEKVAARDLNVVAITHKGVIRSALSAACDWDMAEDFQPKPDWSLPHIFRLGAAGKLELVRLNCPWEQPPG